MHPAPIQDTPKDMYTSFFCKYDPTRVIGQQILFYIIEEISCLFGISLAGFGQYRQVSSSCITGSLCSFIKERAK